VKVCELAEPVYGANFVLLYGTVAELEVYRDAGKPNSLSHTIGTGMLEDSEGIRGRYLQVAHRDGDDYHAMFVRSDIHEVSKMPVAAHECFHATTSVLLGRGLKLTNESEEAFAYYISWLLEHYAKLMMPPKKKRRTRRRK